ncbi:hypothetical protein ACFQ1M_03680 [Sungkyunkwania multivorans]|uniref:Plasmid pRiA4b Orf3-like domain-containing protein n=1 Tax=Sungkyunkwania multivorans TaxID=1173618 RepID=A0ABW3CUU8_9FLAO
MIYRFRVILDTEEDIFRDIEIEANASFEDFHNSIVQAFGFDGGEMASFYTSDNDWNQGEEISMFDTGEGMIMEETSLDAIANRDNTKLIYIYDFLNMWTFFVELADIGEKQAGRTYPNLMFAHGELPDAAPEKQFETEEGDVNSEFDDLGLDIDDYENLDFDENWN